jgi:cathepsin H
MMEEVVGDYRPVVSNTAKMMKVLTTVLILSLSSFPLVSCDVGGGSTSSSTSGDSNIISLKNIVSSPTSSSLSFDDWLQLHSKSYESQEEYNLRFQIWSDNYHRIVNVHNKAYHAGLTSYKMTMTTPFADLTCDEFDQHYLMPKKPRNHCALASSSSTSPSSTSGTTRSQPTKLKPRSPAPPPQMSKNGTTTSSHRIDWRTKGVMTHVKDQGKCGSCWTFATTGTLEAHTCISHRRTDCSTWPGLSEQQLVDCSGGFDNEGCDGGWPSSAMEYIHYNGGIESETSYPYHGRNQNCSSSHRNDNDDDDDNTNDKVVAKVAEVYNITYQDEDDLQDVIATVGPVSFAFQVSPDFRFYSSGVYDSFNATTNTTMCHSKEKFLNHAVVAVGMDVTDDRIPYYIVRNSWSSSWAMEGYFWLKRGMNLCGVSDCASFPIVPANDRQDQDLYRKRQRQNHLRSSSMKNVNNFY